jgi:hypothetical protein
MEPNLAPFSGDPLGVILHACPKSAHGIWEGRQAGCAITRPLVARASKDKKLGCYEAGGLRGAMLFR